MTNKEEIALILRIEGGKETVNEIGDLDEKLRNVRDQIKDMKTDSRGTAEELKKVTTELANLENQGKQNEEEYKNLAKRQDELRKSMQDTEATIKSAAVAERSLREERKGANAELNKQIRDFKKFGQEIPLDSIEGLSRRYSELRTQLRLVPKNIRLLEKEFGRSDKALSTLNPEIREAVIEFRDLSKEAKDTKQEILNFDQGINDFSSNIGNYKSALESLNLGSIFGKGGTAALGFADAFTGGGLGGFGAIGELAQALGPGGRLVAGAAAGAALIGDYVFDITREYERLFDTVTKVTGAQGAQLVEVTARAKTTSEVFGIEFEQVLESVNNTQKAFGDSFNETFDSIEAGLLALGSGEAQQTFIESLREYPQLIEQANFSLDEFIALSIVQQKRGLFDDKLIDSVKEANIALEEFTEAQSTAVKEALGEDFAQDFAQRLRDGTLTTKDAIIELGDNLIESGADLEDYAQITADVFKGAGEDAGGFGEIYEAVADAVELANDGLSSSITAYSERQRDALEATRDLNTEQAILAGQFAGLGTSFDSIITKSKAFGTSLLNDIIARTRIVKDEFEDQGFLSGVAKFFEVSNPANAAALRTKLAIEDAEALAIQTETEQKQADLREKTATDEALKARQKEKRDAEALARNKALAKEEEKLEKDRQKAIKALAKEEEDRAKAREKAGDNIAKIERQIADESAKAQELTLADLKEFDRQIENLKDDTKTAIGSLVGDPEQIQQQTDLITQRFAQQVEALKVQRDKAIDAAGLATLEEDLNRVDAQAGVENLNALSDFNAATGADPSLAAREAAEKIFQERILDIQLSSLLERRAIIEANQDISDELRTQKLIELAETEKDLNEAKNETLLEQEKEYNDQRQEYLDQVNAANMEALEGIGNAVGQLFVDASEDGKAAFEEFGKAVGGVILDLIEKQLILLATSAFSQPDSVLTFGASGALRIALITGLIKGSVGALKSVIGFEQGGGIDRESLGGRSTDSFPSRTGGLIVGPSHENGGVKFRLKGTGLVGEARGGEVIMNEDSVQAGIDMYGPDFLDNIGVPLSDSFYRNYDTRSFVPQIAENRNTSRAGGQSISTEEMLKFANINATANATVLAGAKEEIIEGVVEALTENSRRKRVLKKTKEANRM